MKLVPQNRCPNGQDHDTDLGAGSLEFDDGGDHAYLNVPCRRCGAWAMISAEIVALVWGEPDDRVSTLSRAEGSSPELN